MRDTGAIKAGAILGFALGGFFDGILLHQILGWHHLLSLVPGITDLRLQVMWDGYFHALMYGVAAVGLWLLWRSCRATVVLQGGRLAGALLAGFGGWHILDAILSHWLLGIHRIKMNSPDPLFWDLLWLAGFGLIPAALGLWLIRKGGGNLPRHGSRPVLLALAAITLGAGWVALQPAPGQPLTAVVFRASIPEARIEAILQAADARTIWSDGQGVVLIDLPDGQAWDLYRQGALLVGGAGLPPGCFGWSAA